MAGITANWLWKTKRIWETNVKSSLLDLHGKHRRNESSAKKGSKAQITDRRENYKKSFSNNYKIRVFTDLCLHAVHDTHVILYK